MRVAALYDIHGNLPALEAVLAVVEREGADVIVCGGDALWGPFPRPTLERLLELGERVRFIRGNTERETAAGELRGDEWADAVTRHTAADLGADGLELVDAWPERVTLEVNEVGAVVFCHATPRSDSEIVTRLTPDERLAAILVDVSEPVVVAGHTHTQLDRVVDGTRFVNAGSVGMPYEREAGAYWALLGPDVEPRRTAYDLDEAARRIGASGMPAADAFVRENVVATPDPDETARFFERQAANSEK